MIDTHCHLVDNKFKSDVDEVIGRAKQSGVKHAVVCPEYASQFDAVLDLHAKYPDFVIPAIGIHPIQNVQNYQPGFLFQKKNKPVKASDIEGVEAFLEEHRDVVRCIGEVGLDFTQHYKITSDDIVVQKEVLAKHIIWAKQFGLPMTVHSRAATGDTIDFLVENSADRVALHAFNGNLEEALRGLKAGFFISIPPSFTTGEHVSPNYVKLTKVRIQLRSWERRQTTSMYISSIPQPNT
ncbi:hydrolase, TatD family [Ancylostoma caninum]|uniref:Hydrolase, TatD family n=1 Tax=Ancylostoma caninum TaxID=29170 RepID=A0A368G557_ANCCA|nr:hydrolase, TatD family [Ancylostoma caninum]